MNNPGLDVLKKHVDRLNLLLNNRAEDSWPWQVAFWDIMDQISQYRRMPPTPTCDTCKFWKEKEPLGGMGTCSNKHFVYDDPDKAYPDGFSYYDYGDGVMGGFATGPKFACCWHKPVEGR